MNKTQTVVYAVVREHQSVMNALKAALRMRPTLIVLIGDNVPQVMTVVPVTVLPAHSAIPSGAVRARPLHELYDDLATDDDVDQLAGDNASFSLMQAAIAKAKQ